MFRKYHYLNTELNQSAEQYIATINGKLVAHAGIIQFPLRKGWKRVHRLVVLPDYQGIGIGTSFINEVTKYYIEKGFDMNLTTTTPALVNALKKSNKWVLARFGRSKNTMANFERYGTNDKEKQQNKKKSESLVKTQSDNRITYSFNFKK